MSAEAGAEAKTEDVPRAAVPVRMRPHITAAEALAAFQRKLPGATAEVRQVHHPFWWVPLTVHTRGLFTRGAHVPGQRMDVLVNAATGRGMIADFRPTGQTDAGAGSTWSDFVESLTGDGSALNTSEVVKTARSLARAKVLKTVKLGMGIEISPADGWEARGLLKPNWLVTGANERYAATILVDGLDASHYIVKMEKLSPSSSHPRCRTGDQRDR